VSAGGFAAGEHITVTLHSTPMTLLPTTASASGKVVYTFTVPTTLAAGNHVLTLAGAGGSATFSFKLAAAAPAAGGSSADPGSSGGSLAMTGANVLTAVEVALVLLIAGALAVGLGRSVNAVRAGRHR
jgi:hypothetical protein